MARKATKRPRRARIGHSLLWFEVENFKSIKRLHLDFKPFMVFVGPNGAGKTNVLQALALFLELLADGTHAPFDGYGGFDQLVRRGTRRSAFIRFALCLAIHDKKGSQKTLHIDVRCRATKRGQTAVDQTFTLADGPEHRLSMRWDDGEPQRLEQSGEHDQALIDRLSILQSIYDPYGIEAQSFLQACGLQPIQPVSRLRLDASVLRGVSPAGLSHGQLLGIAGEGLPRAVERIRATPEFKRVLAGLQAVYPRIEDVGTVQLLPGDVALRFKERLIHEGLGQGNVSDGVLHALALLVVLEGSPSEMPLAIEEPENALHPWALRGIVRRAQERERGAPLLMASHSPSLIDAVVDPASLFIVENDEEKGTVVVPALTREKALRAILAESGQKLGEVWLGGGLGGVPDGEP